MADSQQPVDPSNQAGGGTRKAPRTVRELQPNVLTYLKQIFETHAGSDQKWTQEQVRSFVQTVQSQDLNSAESRRLLEHDDGFDFIGFLAYMTSSESAIVKPRFEEDLSWPLCAYFISSSHNTYLTGNQLSSASTTDAYTNVLRRGCRCVEIDVWDGDESDSESSEDEDAEEDAKGTPPKEKTKTKEGRFAKLKANIPNKVAAKLEKTSLGKKLENKLDLQHSSEDKDKESLKNTEVVGIVEPRVLHGYTLTKEVSFRDVCKEIRKSAFVSTDLPLIVSLEVHCGAEQQQAMVDIMKDAWDGVLVDEVDATELPSPETLRGKILVKVKYAPPDAAASTKEDDQSGEDDRIAEPATGKNQPKKPSKIIQALSRLGVYTRAVSFKSWDQPEASMPAHIFSLSEKKFLTHHETNGMLLFNHNRNHLLRAYPSGLRIGSSNLNPPPFWGSGAQIVALNWQQTDEGMMLNEGMFSGTGGYVLKPPGYRPKETEGTITRKTLSVTLTFLAAQNIPLPADDKSAKGFRPYIKTELHLDGNPSHEPVANAGHERDGEYKAHTKSHRGRDIDLGGEKLAFANIPGVVEELSFVRFKVCDDEIGRDDLAAWACVRLDRLGQGYRFIHLWDSAGRMTDGAILVKVDTTLV